MVLSKHGGSFPIVRRHGIVLACLGKDTAAQLTQAQKGCACRELLATGGSNPADCQIMRISDSTNACTSQPALEPVQTLVVGY